MKRGFTLIELLVVMAIVALLLGILLPALGHARMIARQCRSSSDLRQMMIGYTAYHVDHRDQVLWGNCTATVEGSAVTVRLPSGHVLPGAGLALPVMRYPVRLAPYAANVWQVLYSHGTPPGVPQAGDTDAQAYDKAYLLSTNPSFGINGTYVGGDHYNYGFLGGPAYKRNVGKHVVFFSREVRRPSNLIVFTESKQRGGGVSTGDKGYHLATAPRSNGLKWQVTGNKLSVAAAGIMGLPEGRYSQSTVTGFFDGHVAAMTPDQLNDMTLWANRADSPTYDYQP